MKASASGPGKKEGASGEKSGDKLPEKVGDRKVIYIEEGGELDAEQVRLRKEEKKNTVRGSADAR